MRILQDDQERRKRCFLQSKSGLIFLAPNPYEQTQELAKSLVNAISVIVGGIFRAGRRRVA